MYNFFCEYCNIIDTLETLTEDDIIFWEKDDLFTMDEKEKLTEYIYLGGSFILFAIKIVANNIRFLFKFLLFPFFTATFLI